MAAEKEKSAQLKKNVVDLTKDAAVLKEENSQLATELIETKVVVDELVVAKLECREFDVGEFEIEEFARELCLEGEKECPNGDGC